MLFTVLSVAFNYGYKGAGFIGLRLSYFPTKKRLNTTPRDHSLSRQKNGSGYSLYLWYILFCHTFCYDLDGFGDYLCQAEAGRDLHRDGGLFLTSNTQTIP